MAYNQQEKQPPRPKTNHHLQRITEASRRTASLMIRFPLEMVQSKNQICKSRKENKKTSN
jgi:hypothetical protein